MLKHFFFGALALALAAAIGSPVFAVSPLDSGALGDAAGQAAYSTNQDIGVVIGNIIKIALGMLGVIFLVLTIYAGFLWMTAAGNEKQVAKAKSILVSSIIGLVIILTAYSITAFVLGNLLFATQI
jgi:hypothetical protein